VVRHNGDKKLMLLHHDAMTSTDAKALHDTNAVVDLTHNKEDYYERRPSEPLLLQEMTGKDPKQLNDVERVEMESKLAQHRKDAQEAISSQESNARLFFNRKTRQAETVEDTERDAERARDKKRKTAI
jgi:hypothetical protein